MNGCRMLREEFSLSFPSLFELSYSFPHLIRFPCINRVGYHTVPLLVFSSFYTFLLYECTGFYLFLSFFQQWVYMDLVTAFLGFPCFFFLISFLFFSFFDCMKILSLPFLSAIPYSLRIISYTSFFFSLFSFSPSPRFRFFPPLLSFLSFLPSVV